MERITLHIRKMARENDDKQKEAKPPGEETDTITRLVVRMQCNFCGVEKWRMISYRKKSRRGFCQSWCKEFAPFKL
jgi:ribosomal protein L44E